MKSKAEAMKDLAKVCRRLITIQKKTVTTDDIGNQKERWTYWKTLKAERTQLFGQEYYAAAAIGQEQTVVFTVRYLPSLSEMNTTDYRLTCDGATYDIKHIDHLQDGGLWSKIKAMQRPGGKGG